MFWTQAFYQSCVVNMFCHTAASFFYSLKGAFYFITVLLFYYLPGIDFFFFLVWCEVGDPITLMHVEIHITQCVMEHLFL